MQFHPARCRCHLNRHMIFTVADLNVASVLSWVKMARIDLDAFPNLAEWLGRCLGRPALAKVMQG